MKVYFIFSGILLSVLLFHNSASAQWLEVAAGRQHSVAIKIDGTLWTWGRNNYGQLGNGTNIESNTPIQIGTAGNWVAVAAGYNHCLALDANGILWAWGRNGNGQLGNGSSTSSNVPVLVTGSSIWNKITAKGYASAGIKSDGTLWEWGDAPIEGGGSYTQKEPALIDLSENWISVSLGWEHGLAIKSDGSLWAWGWNGEGQFGNGVLSIGATWPVLIDNQNNWTEVVAGQYHSIGIKSNGTMWVWGDNYYGQLGIGSTVDVPTPTQIGTANNWTKIAAGYNHSFAINNTGVLSAWGMGTAGILGTGNVSSAHAPQQVGMNISKVSAGEEHSVLINQSGALCGTGGNSYGELGNGLNSNLLSFTCTTTGTSIINLSGNLIFDDVAIGSSRSETLTIQNAGETTLQVNSIMYPSGGFSGDWDSGSIAPGGSKQVEVTFAPVQIGTHSGNIIVNSTASSGTTSIFCSGNAVQVFPKITLSIFQLNISQILNINCTDLTANGSTKLYLTVPNGAVQEISLTANGNGALTYAYTAPNTPGTYSVRIKDVASGNESIIKTFNVLGAPPVSGDFFQIVLPTAADTVLVDNNTPAAITVVYTDKMFLSAATYPLVGAFRLFQYKVEYSLDNGPWQGGIIQSGQRLVDQMETFTLQLTGTVNTGDCRVRVTDLYNPARQKISPVFVVKNQPVDALLVTYAWDYSLMPQPIESVTGVAADGIGRFFIKVKSTGTAIQSVTVTLSDPTGNYPTAKLGKVMQATVNNTYSEEANLSNSLTATDNTPDANGYYWFWYVAPEDFTRNADDYGKKNRNVFVKVNATFAGGGNQFVTKRIVVVRPPVMLVHGLGGNASTWEQFYLSNGNLLQEDARFPIHTVATMGKFDSFEENAKVLSASGFNSLQSLIYRTRKAGYACNQVDYVCHSMGGSMMRYCLSDTINAQINPVFATFFDKRSYKKGLVHKVITLDTPHNGSPFADLLVQYWWDPAIQILAGIDGYYQNFAPSPAIRNLQVDPALENQGGVKFSATPSNTYVHCIASKIDCDAYNSVVNGGLWTAFYDDYQFLNNPLYDPTVVPTCEDRREMLADLGYDPGFIDASDLIVSTQSQLAGQSNFITTANRTVFDDLTHTPLPFSGNAITNYNPVTDTVLFLLNQDLNSTYFSALSATPNFIGGDDENQNARRLFVSERDGNAKIKIVSPLTNANLLVDDAVSLGISVIDSVGFFKLNVLFQGSIYTTNQAALLISFNAQVNSNLIERQTITAVGYYYLPNGDVEQVVDEVEVYVTTDEAITEFHAAPLLYILHVGDTVRPTYTAQFSTFIAELGNSPILTAAIDDLGVVGYNTDDNSFAALDTGSTFVALTYKSQKDTIFFLVEPSDPTTAIHELSEGASNTGNVEAIHVTIFPNPSAGLFHLSLQCAQAGEFKVLAFDYAGRCLGQIGNGEAIAGRNIVEANLTAQGPGLYWLQMNQEGLPPVMKKVVIK